MIRVHVGVQDVEDPEPSLLGDPKIDLRVHGRIHDRRFPVAPYDVGEAALSRAPDLDDDRLRSC